MQLETLKVFCDVARQRSFSQAAQANHITQSAASQMVSQLERRMQVQLIDRSTRPLQLTALGQSYYDGCKTILDQYLELEASIRSAQTQIAGLVQVAAIYSVGLGDMGQLVQRFAAQQPNAEVHIEYHHPDRVYERIEEGTADLGLVSFPRKSPKLVAVPWREEAMVLACAPNHPLSRLPVVAARQLIGEKYIHFDKNLVIRRHVDRYLRKLGVAVEVVLEFDNIENIKQAVSIGAGVALLPEPTLRREVRGRSLLAIPVAGPRLTRPLGIIHRRRQRLSNAALSFLNLLKADGGKPEGNGKPESNGEAGHLPRPSPNGFRERNGQRHARRTS
ncbi:MAG: LysR family transcriptional regulator [Planctomycetes bacterium]|nr:LysR family transcriptional regulator [Planctomycetota bacterium]